MALWWNRPIWLLAILLMIPILWPELLLRWRFKNQSLEALSGHSPRSSNGLRKLSRLRAIAICAAILSLAGTGILIPTKNRQVVALVDVSASISPAQVEVSRGALLELLGRFNPGDRVAVVDDVLATGGTVAASVELIRRSGADVTGVAVVLELAALGGRSRLGTLPVHALRTV